jgi:hypothetical protein
VITNGAAMALMKGLAFTPNASDLSDAGQKHKQTRAPLDRARCSGLAVALC